MRLEAADYEVTALRRGREGAQRIQGQGFRPLRCRFDAGAKRWLDFDGAVPLDHPDIPTIILTAHGTIENAVEAMRRGAYSYLTKPFEPTDLLLQIERALENRNLNSEIKRLKEMLHERFDFTNIIARSGKMRAILDVVTRIAKLDSTVYIHGESGTGKELVAKAIHLASDRKDTTVCRAQLRRAAGDAARKRTVRP